MVRVLSALFVGLTVVVWSALIWAGHAMVSWGFRHLPSGAAHVADVTGYRADVLANWLPAPLVPSVQALGEVVLPWVASAVAWLPAALPFLTAVAWLVWAVGMLVLLGVGVLLHSASGLGVVSLGARPGWGPRRWLALRQLRRHF